MTKKDYKAIAGAVKDTAFIKANGLYYLVLDEFLGRLGYLFKADNPRFDAERFRAACYGEPFKK